MTDDNRLMQQDAPTVTARSQKMASALSAYARALTFENRSRRNLYRLAGLTPKTRDRIFSGILMVIVLITFVLPMAGGTVYYTAIASPGYVSEVRFIVRSSVPLLSRNRYSSDTVEPKAKIAQDTAVLLNYLDSPAMIQDLEKKIDFINVYGRDDIDLISRIPENPTQDEILKYWKKHYSASVNPKSGIVELNVVAYSPQEAHELVTLVLQLSEQQINRLNSGMWDDLRNSTQKDVDAATKEVSDLRSKIRDTQNQTGVFDVGLSAESLTTILTGIETRIADLKGRRFALSQSVKEGSPQLSDMDRQLAGLEQQSQELRAKATGLSGDGSGNLADYSSVFDQIKLDLKMAEQKLKLAITDLEKVKLVSSLQLIYVDNFTEPTTPDENKYPNIPLALFIQFLVLTAVCGAACGMVIMIRKKMD